MIQISLHKLGRLIISLSLTGLLTSCVDFNNARPYYPDTPLESWEVPQPEETEIGQPKATVTDNLEKHNFQFNGKDSLIGKLAIVQLREGDTLLDIARHFGLGYQHIVEANPGVDLWVPQTGTRVVLPLQFVMPEAKHEGVVINLATMRLFYFKPGKQTALSTWPVGIGREGRSSPLGAMAVVRKMQHPTWYVPESIRKTHAEQGDPLPSVVPPGPDNPLGDYALYLSKASYLIHGTNKPFSIGLRASNGCIRLYPEDIELAFKAIPANTPVQIVNQPYVIGWLNGGLYLEVHEPYEEVDADAEKKNLIDKLHGMEKQLQQKIDWPKVEETLKKQRGIPTPIFVNTPSLKEIIASAPQLERPTQLLGQPEKAEIGKAGWFVRTDQTEDAYRAKKLVAQLNHLGPRIPAYTVVQNNRYQVMGGPFTQEQAARKAQNALLEDFDTKSEIVKPDKDYVPPKPSANPVAKKTDKAEPVKPVKQTTVQPVAAEPAKTAPKPETAKTETTKPVKVEADKPLDWIDQEKAKNPPKTVEKKPRLIILKMPNAM